MIRNQFVDLIDGRDLKVRDHAPFAAVRHDDDLSLCAFDHLTNDLGFGTGWHSATILEADAVHADDGLVGIDVPEIFHGETTCKRIRTRGKFTADQVIMKAGALTYFQ